MTGKWTNAVRTWYGPTYIPSSGGSVLSDYGDIAIGPTGQVAIIYQDIILGQNVGQTPLSLSVNTGGLSTPSAFPTRTVILTSETGGNEWIPATPNRHIDVEPGLAWDRSPGPHSNRLYLVYTDQASHLLTDYNTDIYVTYSDDNGTNWSARLKVNDDSTTTSQFDPRIAVDQTSGNVAVSWYDCRDDASANTKTRFYAAVSLDGGSSYSKNFPIESGQSDATMAVGSDGLPDGSILGSY